MLHCGFTVPGDITIGRVWARYTSFQPLVLRAVPDAQGSEKGGWDGRRLVLERLDNFSALSSDAMIDQSMTFLSGGDMDDNRFPALESGREKSISQAD